ncbi:MAG: DNA-formamidopyrimidine glycosylase [bacterium]
MPELPEVTNIVFGLNDNLKNLTIEDVWTDWPKIIKNPKFDIFRNEVIGKKILNSERVGKNILMHLSDEKTILFHMKMTGHLLYGKWNKENSGKFPWKTEVPGPLSDPYNRFIHLMFNLSNGKQLAMSDVRKFGKVVLFNEGEELSSKDLKDLGPDPMSKDFIYKKFKESINKKENGKIKQVLMDQEIISGIGNIYSDEVLWEAEVHPMEKVKNIPENKLKKIFESTKAILKKSIEMGGDSMSDFRNINGEKGGFQECHKAYRRKGEICPKRGCGGFINRIKVGGRSAHFCETHQKLNN